MTNWQFITIIGTFVLSFFGFILTILGTARATQTSIQASITEQFTAFRNKIKAGLEALRTEIRQNDKRYEERFNRIEADIRRIETDIREIKHDLRQVFKPVLPA
ncbi:MAG: hypothetical protein ACREEM_06395 [Blastocatellia bacterium]